MLTAVALATGVGPFLPTASAWSDDPLEAAGGAGLETNDVALERQFNELCSDLLDECELRLGSQVEAHGMVLVVLGIAIGVAELWLYARFGVIVAQPRVGAAIARRYVLPPYGLLHVPGDHIQRSGQVRQPLSVLISGMPPANRVLH